MRRKPVSEWTMEELKEILKRVRMALGEEDYRVLTAVVETFPESIALVAFHCESTYVSSTHHGRRRDAEHRGRSRGLSEPRAVR